MACTRRPRWRPPSRACGGTARAAVLARRRRGGAGAVLFGWFGSPLTDGVLVFAPHSSESLVQAMAAPWLWLALLLPPAGAVAAEHWCQAVMHVRCSAPALLRNAKYWRSLSFCGPGTVGVSPTGSLWLGFRWPRHTSSLSSPHADCAGMLPEVPGQPEVQGVQLGYRGCTPSLLPQERGHEHLQSDSITAHLWVRERVMLVHCRHRAGTQVLGLPAGAQVLRQPAPTGAGTAPQPTRTIAGARVLSLPRWRPGQRAAPL